MATGKALTNLYTTVQTLVPIQRIIAHATVTGSPPYVINLDPAVASIPYNPNIDIRKTVDYKVRGLRECFIALDTLPVYTISINIVPVVEYYSLSPSPVLIITRLSYKLMIYRGS